MTTFDLTPLLRSTIGFDRMTRMLESSLTGNGSAPSYPPYNIEKLGEDQYRIALAVAGFTEDDINITVQDSSLTVEGRLQDAEEDVEYLHRGIAARAFERRFQLADHIEIKGARMENGMLYVDMVRQLPERMKPRNIEIAPSQKQIEQGKKSKKVA